MIGDVIGDAASSPAIPVHVSVSIDGFVLLAIIALVLFAYACWTLRRIYGVLHVLNKNYVVLEQEKPRMVKGEVDRTLDRLEGIARRNRDN